MGAYIFLPADDMSTGNTCVSSPRFHIFNMIIFIQKRKGKGTLRAEFIDFNERLVE
jgi:hypothetical protein